MANSRSTRTPLGSFHVDFMASAAPFGALVMGFTNIVVVNSGLSINRFWLAIAASFFCGSVTFFDDKPWLERQRPPLRVLGMFIIYVLGSVAIFMTAYGFNGIGQNASGYQPRLREGLLTILAPAFAETSQNKTQVQSLSILEIDRQINEVTSVIDVVENARGYAEIHESVLASHLDSDLTWLNIAKKYLLNIKVNIEKEIDNADADFELLKVIEGLGEVEIRSLKISRDVYHRDIAKADLVSEIDQIIKKIREDNVADSISRRLGQKPPFFVPWVFGPVLH